jgi:hypothetical protein
MTDSKKTLEYVLSSTKMAKELADTAEKLFGSTEFTQEELIRAARVVAKRQRKSELFRVTRSVDRRIESLTFQLRKKTQELEIRKQRMNDRRWGEIATNLETFLFSFVRRRSNPMTRGMNAYRLRKQGEYDVEQSRTEVLLLKERLESALEERIEVRKPVIEKWQEILD